MSTDLISKKEAVLSFLSISMEDSEISTDQFIEDTTSSIFCISWRSGDEAQRAEMEQLLNTFERTPAKDFLKKVAALDDLTGKARVLSTGGLTKACERIVKKGQQLRGRLTDTDEYRQAEEEKKDIERRMASEKEQERLDDLAKLPLEDRINAFAELYGGALLETLLDGTAALESADAKVLRLAQNFKNIGFTYTMKNSNFKSLLGGSTKGDCNTLSKAMAAICNEIFMISASVEGIADLLVSSTERTIDSAKAPNAEVGAFWIFENHYWVIANGKRYDPLFGREFSDEGWHPFLSKREFKDLGIIIEDYGDEYRMVMLMGVERKRISRVTEQEWETHRTETLKIKRQADKSAERIGCTFEEMQRRISG